MKTVKEIEKEILEAVRPQFDEIKNGGLEFENELFIITNLMIEASKLPAITDSTDVNILTSNPEFIKVRKIGVALVAGLVAEIYIKNLMLEEAVIRLVAAELDK